MPEIPKFLAVIVNRQGVPQGMGSLVDPDTVLTCAHVVNLALGRSLEADEKPNEDTTVEVVFPFSEDDRRGWVKGWCGPTDASANRDLCLLRLTASVPDGLHPVEFSETQVGQSFKACRRTGRNSPLEWGYGRIQESAERDWYQVGPDHPQPTFISHGFSGGPVICRRTGQVLGMVQRWNEENQVVGHIASTERLRKFWKPLLPPDNALIHLTLVAEPKFTPPECLASFTELDRDFYPRLLPGPERDDLPEAIGIWKRAIDQREKSFRVGLIRGPSGCGKSSLVRAGILPRLGRHVEKVFLEAVPDRTERRLRTLLCEKMALWLGPKDLPDDCQQLADVFRRAKVAAAKAEKKLLVVIDQCEQWLPQHPQPAATELAQALKECDGVHLQALLLVREDYSVSLMRLVREFGQELDTADVVERVCFLFEPEHAERVLAIFGRGHQRPGYEPTSDFDDWPDDDPRRQFLRDAVELLQGKDGTVVALQIALFAWMMRSKDWQARELDSSFQQLGLKYLQRSLDPPHGNTTLRGYLEGVKRILRQLLPPGAEKTKVLQSAESLKQAFGNDAAFSHVIHELDTGLNGSGLRLITPTQPDETGLNPPVRQYRLTHDFFIEPLRAWLHEGLQKTWHGRKVIQAQRLAQSWQNSTDDKPRFLPGSIDYPLMLCAKWMYPQDWRDNFMDVPGYWHATRNRTGLRVGVIVIVLLLLISVVFWSLKTRWDFLQARDNLRVDGLVKDLRSPLMTDGLNVRRWDEYRKDRARLEPQLGQLETEENQHVVKNAELARLAFDPDGAVTLVDRLVVQTDPRQFDEMVMRIAEYADQEGVTEKLTAIVSEGHQSIQFYRPNFEEQLVELGQRKAKAAIALIRLGKPDQALSILEPVPFAVSSPPQSPWNSADTGILRERGLRDDLKLQAQLVKEAGILKGTKDPEGQTQFIHNFLKFGVAPEKIRDLFENHFNKSTVSVDVRYALLICLSQCIPPDDPARDRLRQKAIEIYRTDPSAAVHGAARWLLTGSDEKDDKNSLGFHLSPAAIRDIDCNIAEDAQTNPNPSSEWMVRIDRNYPRTFIRFVKSNAFPLGTPRLTNRFLIEFNRELRSGSISHSFWICQQEVTREEYDDFAKDVQASANPLDEKFANPKTRDTWAYPELVNPIGNVRWYHAIRFCQWLTEDSGQRRYESAPLGLNETTDLTEANLDWKVVADYQARGGFRLPTEIEWEYACRAGTGTSFSFGCDYALTIHYAWFLENRAQNLVSHPGCTRLPNLRGLFDMHGNMLEWCEENGWNFGKVDDEVEGRDRKRRLLRGGGWQDPSHMSRSGWLYKYFPWTSHSGFGFRLAFTDIAP